MLGNRAVDRRTTVGKALAGWRDELIGDLGGDAVISMRQRALVDLVVRTKLMLDSVDAWLLRQPSLVNVRKRSLLPVVRERTQLADAVARYLAALGLERRVKAVTPIHEYLAKPNGPFNGRRAEVHVALGRLEVLMPSEFLNCSRWGSSHR